ncbi:MAG: hypothetical protein AAFN27_06290 [Pseudomonadota bacterium]
MSKIKLGNDLSNLQMSLFQGQHALLQEQAVTTDVDRLKKLDKQLSRISKQLNRLFLKRVADLTQAMLSDPQTKADLQAIRDGTEEVKAAAEKISKVTDRLKSVKKMIDKAVKPIDKIVGFLT